MSKVSKATAKKEEFGPVTDCNAEVDGYRIGFATFHDDIDGTPLMKGLPDDMCQCPHWGYVLRGKVVFRYADHDEEYEATRSTRLRAISRSSTSPVARS